MKNPKNKPDRPAGSGWKSNIKPILAVTLNLLVICAVIAFLLSAVNALTADKIASNIAREKSSAINTIFPEADENQPVDIGASGVDEIRLVFSGGDLLGYAALVNPVGFGGKIEIMVGVNTDGTLAGIEIVNHSETPGIGNRIDDVEYLSQYKGRGGQLALGGTGGIDAITGSTISSKAVIAGVNSALAAYGAIFTENDVISGGGAK